MSYIDEILQPGERVNFRTGPSRWLYAPSVLLLLAAAALAIWSLQMSSGFGVYALILAAVLALVAVIVWFPAFMKRWTTELVATDRRVIYKTGLLRRHTIEMNMDKVESVNVDQSIWGRLFNYGTVEIHGTGGGLEPLPAIDSPLAFRNHVTAA
jgi:uncharacterized membrane protein YdbT with pleckstrin-like domain